MAGFRKFGILVAPAEALRLISADPEGDKFVECALAGAAGCIVIGDAHLLKLRE